MKNLSFVIDKKIVYVKYEQTSNKNMYLKVTRDNQLLVTAPPFISEKDVKKFVQDNLPRFLKHIEKREDNEYFSLTKKYMMLHGKSYKLIYLSGYPTNSFTINASEINLKSKSGSDQEFITIIKSILLSETKKYMEKHHIKMEKKMATNIYSLKYSYRHSTWGTNVWKRKEISYSTKLAHLDDEVKDYLIVHELAHDIEHNHSPSFWNIVNQYCPEYKIIKKKLGEFRD